MNILEEVVNLMLSEDEKLYFNEIYQSLKYRQYQLEEAIKTLIIAGIVVEYKNPNGNIMYKIKP